MRRLEFSQLAEDDLEAIAEYIARDNPGKAVEFVREIRAHCLRIASNPLAYRIRPDLDKDVRSCAFGKYVIYFDIDGPMVLILRIQHGARDRHANWVHDEPS